MLQILIDGLLASSANAGAMLLKIIDIYVPFSGGTRFRALAKMLTLLNAVKRRRSRRYATGTGFRYALACFVYAAAAQRVDIACAISGRRGGYRAKD